MNPTPDNDEVLEALCEDLADGAHDHEVSMGIKQNTEVVLRASLDTAVAAKNLRAAKDVIVGQKYDLQQAADTTGEDVLGDCRLRMVKLFGGQHDSNWEAAGWTNGSTAVPDTQDERFVLLKSMKNYFITNPTAESVDMDATAAICLAAHTAISDARAAVHTAQFNQTNARDAHKAAYKSLRKRVRGFIAELATLLADDDTRYELFGLNIPANPTPPEGIASLTLTALGSARVLLKWPYATRSGGTRILVKRVGVDTEFVSIGTTDSLEKVLESQTVGQTIEVKVIPYNEGGDGPASPVGSVVVT